MCRTGIYTYPNYNDILTSALSYYSPCILPLFKVVSVDLEQVSYTVTEENEMIEVCVVLTGMIERNVTIILTTMEGTAQIR